MSQEALGPPGDKTFCLSRLGEGLPVALGDGKSPLPPSLYEAFGRVNLSSSLPFTGKLITKFLKSDEILSIF